MYANSHLPQKVESIVEKDYVILPEDVLVAEAAKVMRNKDVSSVLVSSKNSNEAIGIVTERDIIYRVVAESKGPIKITLKEIMTSPLISVPEEESIKNAILLMRRKHIRRLGVKKADGKIIGTVTLMSMVGNAPSDSIDLADIELPSNIPAGGVTKIICPYCHSEFKDKSEMSKHIDRIHIGSGLLEGDMRRW
jgi:CBS domain-containing protein